MPFCPQPFEVVFVNTYIAASLNRYQIADPYVVAYHSRIATYILCCLADGHYLTSFGLLNGKIFQLLESVIAGTEFSSDVLKQGYYIIAPIFVHFK